MWLAALPNVQQFHFKSCHTKSHVISQLPSKICFRHLDGCTIFKCLLHFTFYHAFMVDPTRINAQWLLLRSKSHTEIRAASKFLTVRFSCTCQISHHLHHTSYTYSITDCGLRSIKVVFTTKKISVHQSSIDDLSNFHSSEYCMWFL